MICYADKTPLFDEVFYMCICYLIYALQESIFSCLRQFFQSAVSSPPPAGIAHSPQVSKGMNVWGIMYIMSCVLEKWCLEKCDSGRANA